MKKLFLFSFSVVVFIFWFQQDSETQTVSQQSIQAAGGNQKSEAGPVAEDELRTSSAKAIKLIQHSQVVWYKKQVCTSCHHQLIPEIPITLARERGVSIDEKIAGDTTTTAFAYLKDFDAVVQGHDFIDVLFDGLAISTANIVGVKPSISTSAYAQFIASRQLADGSWNTMDARPPQAHSLFTATAVCAQAIRHYLPAQLKAEQERRLALAREWLIKTQPRTTEDKAFQLFGLRWTGASGEARQKAARLLLADQREDGGWAQLSTMKSDAYATGEALIALVEGAGLATSDPAYQRGLRFLLKTQEPDGSWHVKSRLNPPAPVSPAYFNSEFPPFQHDQFVSIMGTSWAAAAMLHAIPPRQWAKLNRGASVDFAEPADQAVWMRVALNGNAVELKKLLDRGLSPNEKTAQGTTVLMLAARDMEKVKMLIERGADVNARAETGITPLMIAARYKGNAEVVRLMLKKGARPNADKGVTVRNDASAFFYAMMAGDLQTAKVLADAGARTDVPMKVLGVFYVSPLIYTTFSGDAAMADYLISKGANPNEEDVDGVTVLEWAVISNHAEVAQVLLARGAQVNRVDKFGMTPLLYAASIDFGDTAVMEKLIAAGANLQAKNKQGQTALDLANNYRYQALANLLSGKTARR